MPARRVLPDTATLKRWVDEGMTHAQIAQRIFAETGEAVSRSTVSAALSRAGLTADGVRYDETLPWRVKVQHIKEYPARMLRLLGKRRNGGDLTADETKRLDSWLAMLEQNDAVVAYAPEATQGFHYVDRLPTDSTDIPIRRQTIRLKG